MEIYFKRALETEWLTASDQFPVLLLTGPRQVGKTTMLRHICEKSRRYVSLDDPTLRVLANEDPNLFLQRFGPPVLIDEIQYAPTLLPYIKMSVDAESQSGMYWLTGSQQFQMMRGITETLAGRVAIVNLLGFSGRESLETYLNVVPFYPTRELIEKRRKFSFPGQYREIFERIWLGSFPALVTGKTQKRDLFYSSYIQTYLQRDVADLTQVGDQETFFKFIKVCAARTAQQLNYSTLASELEISVPTVKNWISILQASFQVFILPPFSSNLTKRLVKTPKMYFLDTGLCAYLTQWSSPETLSSGAMAGHIFETYVVVELLKSWWHKLKTPSLFYYRDKDKKEIDLLIEKDNLLHPIEIKCSANPQKKWIANFSTLHRFGNIGQGAVICLIDDDLPLNENNHAIPIGYL